MFGANVICIDSTHGTNAYNFKLVTMMVVDDFGEGQQTLVLSLIKKFFMISKTVAWCICTQGRRETPDAVSPICQALLARDGNTYRNDR